MRVKTSKGFDLPIDGLPLTSIAAANPINSVALLGGDYIGLEPRMLVQEGDRVNAGQPLFIHKRDPDVIYTAPASGMVKAINRGARRVLKSVVIELQDEQTSTIVREPEPDPHAVSQETLRDALLKSGLWTAFRTRPFSRVPDSRSTPHSIFVTAIDTQPLSADPSLVIAEYEAQFGLGLDLLGQLTDGAVFLCTAPDWSGPTGSHPAVEPVAFEGPHPAGLPGTHIHHLDPVSVKRTAWHIGYQDVIAIGKLIGEGRLCSERIVALGGNGLTQPTLMRARLGANLKELTAGELKEHPVDQAPRRISGSVLNGREAEGSEAYLGRYHVQVSVISQIEPIRRLRWRSLFDRRYSFAGIFARSTGHVRPTPFTTSQNGRATALVPIDAFERVIPMNVLTEPLLRALLIKDTDQAQALGCLELDEEDLALCSFICPGKNDYGAVLRANLDQIELEG
jgi:Na+-transporting NADH:ubiquinone oxidoreductase subunit A